MLPRHFARRTGAFGTTTVTRHCYQRGRAVQNTYPQLTWGCKGPCERIAKLSSESQYRGFLMELIVKYDDRSLAAAAKTLFFHRWHPLFPWIAACLTMLSLTVGAISLVLGGPVDTTVIFLSLGTLSTLGSLTGFAQHRRRIMRRSGEVARLELREHMVRVESASGSAEIPWTSLVQIDGDLLNVLLYVSRGVAVIIPTGSLPAAAMEFLERKRLELGQNVQ